MKNKYPDSVFTLDQEDAIDPETYETFAGQWDSDARHGFGVCERSDGVTYEGQWFQNQRHGYGQTRFRDGSCEQGRYQNGKLVFLSWTKGTKAHLLLYNYHIKRGVAHAVERARAVAETARQRANEARENLDTVANAMEHAKQAAEVARDYSLETRELVKEMYPNFEQPGLKYLANMVQLMRVTKRGNQAFESAFLTAQDVINGVGTAGLSEVPNGEHTPNHLDALPNDHAMEGHSPPGSRAGSYRRRRRSRQINTRVSRQIKASPEDQDMFLRAPDITDQPCEESTVVDSSMPNLSVTLLVPQFTNYDLDDPGSPRNHVDALTSVRPTSHDRVQPTRAQKPTKSRQHDFLSVPTPHGQGQVPIGEDSEGSVESLDVRPRVARSPSVVSTYVTIPHVNELQPTSEIPHIPLSRLIENCDLLDDHFYHYKKNPATASPGFDQSTGIPTGSVSLVKRPADQLRRNPADDWPHSIHADETYDRSTEGLRKPINSSAVGTQQQGFRRRRTLPAFLTQQPLTVATPPMYKTVADRTSENPLWMDSSMTAASPDTETLHDKPTILLGADQVAPVVEGSSHHTPHMAESVIYLMDEGVRKRLRAQPSETTRLSHSPGYPQSLYQTRAEALQSVLPRGDRPGHETTHVTRPRLPSSSVQTKEVRQPLCVGNVLLEDLQDELAPLPTEFKESNLDIRQKPGRLSVPYLPDFLAHSSGAAGLTPDEISLLAEKSLRKREDEAARKRQGEIVIHLVDLFDWCNRNLLIIVVLAANCLLVYCFLILLFIEEAQDQT